MSRRQIINTVAAITAILFGAIETRGQDCNTNGTPDATDIANGAPDCNSNSVPDVCEILVNRSLQLDGVDDVVSLPDNVLPWTSGPTTIEIWFRTSTSGVIVGQIGQDSSSQIPVIYVGTDGNGIQLARKCRL